LLNLFFLKINLLEREFAGKISREELGRAGWTLLHMISATAPSKIDSIF